MTPAWATLVAAAALGTLASAARAAERPATPHALWTELPASARRGRTPALSVLVERARSAVVQVRGTTAEPKGGKPKAQGTASVGTGFFIDGSGYALTNEHVIQGVSDVHVTFYDGRDFPACVVGADEPTDLALLKVDVDAAVPVLPLGDPDDVRVGDPVVAIGSPFGFNHSVTAGILSAKERVIDRGQREGTVRAATEGYSFFLQTDAAINVGNSGGPLIDQYGAVIGVNAAFWSATQAAQGISFAIPIHIAKLLLPRLKRDGAAPRSYLGVDSQTVTAALAEGLKLPSRRGALIASVQANSPAAAAGLAAGDVVVAWGGRPLAREEDFKIYAQLSAPGTEVRLSVLRAGATSERTLITRAADEKPRPQHRASCSVARVQGGSSEGFDVRAVPDDRARPFGGAAIEVARVHGDAAQAAGLQVGDVLLQVGDKRVRTVSEMREALRAAPGRGPVPLLLSRDGAGFWAALRRR